MKEKAKNVLTSLKKRDCPQILGYLLTGLEKIGISLSLDYIYLEDLARYHKTPPTDFKVVIGKKEDLPKLAPILDKKKHKIFMKRMELGNLFYLLEHQGKVVGYRWLSKDRNIYPKEILLRYLPENTIYAYDAFVFPEFREQGLFGLMTSKIAQDNAEKVVKLGSISSFFNKSAQKAKEKYNAKKECLAFSVKLFNVLEFNKKLKSYR